MQNLFQIKKNPLLFDEKKKIKRIRNNQKFVSRFTTEIEEEKQSHSFWVREYESINA